MDLYRELSENLDWAVAHHYALKDSVSSVRIGKSTFELRYPSRRGPRIEHPRPAMLCHADLAGVGIEGAVLPGAMLPGSNLSGAYIVGDLDSAVLQDVHLSKATLLGSFINTDFSNADLTGAVLNGANLSRTRLEGTHLQGADLNGTDFDHADLGEANLDGTNLISANLANTSLLNASLSNAELAGTDLTNALYEPVLNAPNSEVFNIKGLGTLKSDGNVSGMVRLRILLSAAGLQDSVRAISSSIERGKTSGDFFLNPSIMSVSSGILRTVAFDLPTSYGLYPERALILIVVFGSLLVPIYLRQIFIEPNTGERTAGIYKVMPANQPSHDEGASRSGGGTNAVRLVSANGWRAFGWASYFSLLSSVNIGFEQLTPGDWIRRLQPTEFTLLPLGWVRVVSGAQSLLSLYLLAMWALTRFGNLFQ
ncbi:MAG TPA: pentapeptide repeat-containing protein [Candidatus Binatia bacterium]|nr:pentapeptide repeat-containing protein [Candidatus Binatia bacterium]